MTIRNGWIEVVDTAVVALKQLLEGVGHAPQWVDDERLELCLARRMKVTGVTERETYAGMLAGSSAEQAAALEMLLVQESWFYRDIEPFHCLQQLAAGRHPGARPLRLLSLACASGEEPYSMAIALFEAQLNAAEFCLDAVDIDPAALGRARLGEFGERSLRALPADLRARYFEAPAHQRMTLRAWVRESVTFHGANLCALPPSITDVSYDVIFLRNVMIYLAPAARHKVLATVERILAPDGVVVVGHAEGGLLPAQRFERVGAAGSFAFRQRSEALARPHAPPTAPGVSAGSKSGSHLHRSATAHTPDGREVAAGSSGPVPPSDMDAHLACAVAWADGGQYDEAEVALQRLLRQAPLEAEIHFQLGLICAAQNRVVEARQHFMRAVYLDPDHADSQHHLDLLSGANEERNGRRWSRGRNATVPESRP